ncbi:ABC transporter ATP-binding protein [Haloactinomyces albus]|uniref:ABC-type multidrug transport system fused ATPase/permease subunit n=1 Tax=Haloactinomyces albus TaxID=1352928 RepID=A0AAE3ZFL3_9ACTN|nr:ABC transporter ATP-binding protein [Haloactinomyces albus]MDR7303992.1 ABC-type multidrug transport system fused ATPase/permease subunit [Haloactinomyces albus]
MSRTDRTTSESMPRLLSGNRRALLAVLVSTGVAQAALAGVTAVTMPHLMQAGSSHHRWTALGILLPAALGMGLVRILERVLAEKLGQDYVHEMRAGLIASSLAGARGPSLGTTIARTTNDLSAIRNWIAWGIAPMAGGVPLLVGVLVVLAVLHRTLALVVLCPILVLCAVLALLARPALTRARRVRKQRGRLASHVSDTVAAGSSIRAGGGVHRELKKIDQLSMRVCSAAVHHARIAGYLRGTAAATAAVSTLCVVTAGSWFAVDPATIATAITIVGMMSTPIHDLGRVMEYRQSYLAARRILAPALTQGAEAAQHRRQRTKSARTDHVKSRASGTEVHVSDLHIGHVDAPGLVAAPGARVLLHSRHPERIDAVVGLLAGVDAQAKAWVRVTGRELADQPPAKRRRQVGYAARGLALERGTIARAVRYRNPNSKRPIEPVLRAVGLDQRVATLPDSERTKLRRGGEPLSLPDIARLQLARALYEEPPLLVLDHIDDQLDTDGRAMLLQLLANYPGVAILATETPETTVPDHQVWDLDAGSDPSRIAMAGFRSL